MLCQDRLRTDTENKSTAQLFYTAPHRRGVEGNGLRENGLFWSFLYVCPEPVLVKRWLFYINGSKARFFLTWLHSGVVKANPVESSQEARHGSFNRCINVLQSRIFLGNSH